MLLGITACSGGGKTENDPREAGAARTATPPGQSTAAGVVRVDGSSTVYPITQEAKSGFSRLNADVRVLIGVHGTTGGFSRYLSGEVDIINASRVATPEEETRARENALDWTSFVVGYDGITVVVNPTNTFVDALSVQQLKQLFEPESRVHTWRDLDPRWPDRKINLYVPDQESGTFDFFTETIVGQLDAQRTDTKTSADDSTLVKDVAGDPDGLGYFGFAYYNSNKADIRAVPIRRAPGEPAVTPTLSTLLKREYTPLGRPLFIYVKNEAMKRPEVAEFVHYYLEQVEELATLAGYVPPSSEDLRSNVRALESLIK